MCSCISFPQTPWYHTMHYLVIPRHTQSMVAYKHGPLGVISMSTIKADLWYVDGYKIKHSCVVCWTWIAPGGRCQGACLHTGPKTPMRLVKQKALFCEQWSTVACKVYLSEYMCGVCVIMFGGTTVLPFATLICGHTQSTHCILYVGTTPLVKGTAQLYFGL